MSLVRDNMIGAQLDRLISYGLTTGLIEKEDLIYSRNKLLEFLKIEEYEETGATAQIDDLEDILKKITDYAYHHHLIKEEGITGRDLFDTALMSQLVSRPSEVIKKFKEEYLKAPSCATDFFYYFCQSTDYIRRYRIKNDKKWKTRTDYGELDITINLSKPEKDPKEIAAAKHVKTSSYPKCLLCMENEGYAGRMNHPARQNHRIIPITIQNTQWGLQYSPYVYYNEHCIVINGQHVPMQINRDTFCKLMDFVKLFPHYFLGSNADLPIVGGSILSHDHFQGGNYEFPMAKAEIERIFTIKNFEDIQVGIIKWPMSVIRIRSKNPDRLIELADFILGKWRSYTDQEVFIHAFTGDEPHNTITPIARKRGEYFEFDLALRNNITTKEHPMGVYHPHDDLHHIKKENIGLIEVMGLAILPSRLKEEMELLAKAILYGEEIKENERISKHANWVEEFLPFHEIIHKDNIEEILEKEIGLVFLRVLEDAGVYKRDEQGKEAFDRFIHYLSF